MIFYSAIQPIYFLLPLAGFVIGLFGSMLGGGGGFFFLPILALVLNVPMPIAVTTSLVATLPICIAGTLGHYQKSNVNFRIAGMFALSGIAGSIIGAGITNWMESSQLRIAFGIYSVLMAAHITVNTLKNRKYGQQENSSGKPAGPLKKIKGTFFGFVSGMVTGAFGTSGTAPVLAGLFSMRLPFKVVIGTSLLVVLVNTVCAVGVHFVTGKIDMTLVGFLTIGSGFGALAGPRVLSGVKIGRSENKLKYLYAIVILAIGLSMIISSLKL